MRRLNDYGTTIEINRRVFATRFHGEGAALVHFHERTVAQLHISMRAGSGTKNVSILQHLTDGNQPIALRRDLIRNALQRLQRGTCTSRNREINIVDVEADQGEQHHGSRNREDWPASRWTHARSSLPLHDRRAPFGSLPARHAIM